MHSDLEMSVRELSLRMRLLRAVQEAQSDDDDLNERESLMLELLNSRGKMTISEIASAYPDLSDSTISTNITRMWRDKGLVSKSIDPQNQRVTYVELTDKGESVLQRYLQQRADRMKMFFNAIAVTDQEKKILIDVFDRATDYIDKHFMARKNK